MTIKPTPSGDDPIISMEFPARHWTLILAGIELLNRASVEHLNKLRSDGVDHTKLSPAVTTALVGPSIIRGIIVKELAGRGIMKTEADERIGIDAIMADVEQFEKKYGKD